MSGPEDLRGFRLDSSEGPHGASLWLWEKSSATPRCTRGATSISWSRNNVTLSLKDKHATVAYSVYLHFDEGKSSSKLIFQDVCSEQYSWSKFFNFLKLVVHVFCLDIGRCVYILHTSVLQWWWNSLCKVTKSTRQHLAAPNAILSTPRQWWMLHQQVWLMRIHKLISRGALVRSPRWWEAVSQMHEWWSIQL